MNERSGFPTILWLTIRKDWLEIIRYPGEFITMMFILSFYAIGIAWGISTVVPMGQNFLLAYLIYTLFMSQFGAIVHYIGIGAEMGTLQKELSGPSGIFTLTAASSASNLLFSVIRLVVIIGLAAICGFTFSFDPALTLSVVLISIIFFAGLGYIFGCLMILFKDIGSAIALLSWGMLILGVAATSTGMPEWTNQVFRWFPYTQLTIIMARTGIGGESLPQVASELIPLAISSVLFLLLGVWLFHIAYNSVRRRGSLGHY